MSRKYLSNRYKSYRLTDQQLYQMRTASDFRWGLIARGLGFDGTTVVSGDTGDPHDVFAKPLTASDDKHGGGDRKDFAGDVKELQEKLGVLRDAALPFSLFASALDDLPFGRDVLKIGNQSIAVCAFRVLRDVMREIDQPPHPHPRPE